MNTHNGSWILVRDELPVSLPVPALSIWYAQYTDKLFYSNEFSPDWAFSSERMEIFKFIKDNFYFDDIRFKQLILEYQTTNDIAPTFKNSELIKDFIEDVGIYVEHQMLINTPWGTCEIKPPEYNAIDTIEKYFDFISENMATIHLLNTNNTTRDYIKQIMSMPHKCGADIIKLIKHNVPQLYNNNSYYIELNDDIKEMFCKHYVQEPHDVKLHKHKKCLLSSNTHNFFYNELY